MPALFTWWPAWAPALEVMQWLVGSAAMVLLLATLRYYGRIVVGSMARGFGLALGVAVAAVLWQLWFDTPIRPRRLPLAPTAAPAPALEVAPNDAGV